MCIVLCLASSKVVAMAGDFMRDPFSVMSMFACGAGINILVDILHIERSFAITGMHLANAKPANTGVTAATIARAELPRLDLLRSFEAAARRLSFTPAADELFLRNRRSVGRLSKASVCRYLCVAIARSNDRRQPHHAARRD